MRDLVKIKYNSSKQEHKLNAGYPLRKAILIALLLIILVIVAINLDVTILQALIAQNQNLGFLIGLFVLFLASVTLIPTIPFTLFMSILMGPVPATLITTIGTTLAAFVHYHVGKKIGDVLHFEEKKARLPFKISRLPVASPLFLLAGRLAPGGPVGLSFVCGAYAVPYFSYFWTTFVTNLFGSALVAFGIELFKL